MLPCVPLRSYGAIDISHADDTGYLVHTQEVQGDYAEFRFEGKEERRDSDHAHDSKG